MGQFFEFRGIAEGAEYSHDYPFADDCVVRSPAATTGSPGRYGLVRSGVHICGHIAAPLGSARNGAPRQERQFYSYFRNKSPTRNAFLLTIYVIKYRVQPELLRTPSTIFVLRKPLYALFYVASLTNANAFGSFSQYMCCE